MKAFLIALQFLTRIHLVRQTVWSDRDFGRAVPCFPLVGIVIGLFLCLVNYICAFVFSGIYLAILLTVAGFFITGGLHADGYMDTADGIFSGRDRERMLEIMKDSRVGAHGVMAFVFLVLLKICFIANIAPSILMAALISVPAAGRFGTLLSIFRFPYARAAGLGRIFVENAPSQTLGIGFVFALLPALYGGMLSVVLVGAAVLVSLAANTYITSKLGGVTGDTYGAVTEFTEMLLYGVAAVIGGCIS